MLPLRILPLVLLAASAAVWAQSETSSTSNEKPVAPAPAQSSAGANSTNAPASPRVLPDSTALVPVKMKRADYPQLAAERGIQGQVVIKVHISETGDVENVEIVSGDPILADAAVRAAKKWKFKPFIKDGKPIKVATQLPMDFAFSGKIMDKGISADGTTKGAPGTMAQSNLPAGATEASPSSAAPSDVPQRVRVSRGVSQGLLIHQVAPVYPPFARASRVQGKVVLQAVIGKDGRLSSLHVISGPTELRDAAVGAVQQWRYKPYYLKGEPVEVETQITINFALR